MEGRLTTALPRNLLHTGVTGITFDNCQDAVGAEYLGVRVLSVSQDERCRGARILRNESGLGDFLE
jgi:hypothetical protein